MARFWSATIGVSGYKHLVFCLIAASLAPASLLRAGVEITVPRQFYPHLDEIVRKMADADRAQNQEMKEYSSVRTYTLQNHRMKAPAQLVVRVEYRKDQGKTFDVLRSEEAHGIAGSVLRRVVETEAQASKSDGMEQSKVNSQNYDSQLSGTEVRDGRQCYVLELLPKAKSKYLLRGTVWVDAQDYAIVRVEGRPTASVSFWAGKPLIIVEFQKVGAYWVVSRNHSHADGRLVGATDLTIDCSEYVIKGTDQPASSIARNSSALPVVN
jgi:hypothetical protein